MDLRALQGRDDEAWLPLPGGATTAAHDASDNDLHGHSPGRRHGQGSGGGLNGGTCRAAAAALLSGGRGTWRSGRVTRRLAARGRGPVDAAAAATKATVWGRRWCSSQCLWPLGDEEDGLLPQRSYVVFANKAMAARFFLCLAAALVFCCLALLVPPVQGRLGIGLAGSRTSGGSDEVGGTTVKATPAWSSPWTVAGSVRPELRSVPGGPDPLHHHGSPWRPELDPTTP
nr:unnamed protein product [Digitaria exilis]